MSIASGSRADRFPTILIARCRSSIDHRGYPSLPIYCQFEPATPMVLIRPRNDWVAKCNELSFTNLPASTEFPAHSVDVGRAVPARVGRNQLASLLMLVAAH
jgi:hypothetical protein